MILVELYTSNLPACSSWLFLKSVCDFKVLTSKPLASRRLCQGAPRRCGDGAEEEEAGPQKASSPLASAFCGFENILKHVKSCSSSCIFITLCYIRLYYITLYYIMLCYIILYFILFYVIVLYSIVLCFSISYYSIVTILYYTLYILL